MRIFKNKAFNKWAKGEGLTTTVLRGVADEMAKGSTGDSLGKKVFKKRVALSGRGKRGGARVIIAFKSDGNIFFMYGYAKNEQSDITKDDKKALQKAAATFLDYTDKQLNRAVNKKALFEIKHLKKKH